MPGSDLRLLALDGGGVRGLSALMILGQLMEAVDPEAPPKPCDYFDMIGGTGTGGLIAIMLGRLKMSVKDCIAAYLSLSGRVFHKTRSRMTIKGKLQGCFDAEELKKAVKEIVRQQGVQEDALLKDTPGAECKVFVCATSKKTADIVCLTSYETPRGNHDLLNSVTIWEACRATSAATTFFDPVALGMFREEFVDGAVAANNPVRELWDQAQMVWRLEPLEGRVKCLVSIGTGVPSFKPFKDSVLTIGKTLFAIATETEQTAEMFRREKPLLDSTGRYYRFNVIRGLDEIGLDEAAKLKEIAAATRRYIASQEVYKRIQAFAGNVTGGECFGEYQTAFSLEGVPQVSQFVDRPAEMAKLEQGLLSRHQRGSRQNIYVLHGLGGMGKTQLAVEFARRHYNRYSAVFWLDGRSEDSLKRSIARCAVRIPESQVANMSGAYATDSSVDVDAVVRGVMRWLARPDNSAWLLIFDNIDHEYSKLGSNQDAYDLKRYLSGADHGSVLITTRLAKLKQLGASQQLGKVDNKQAQAILETWYKRPYNMAESDSLLQRLDGLPLAIAQAGVYLQESGVRLETYLCFYDQQWSELMIDDAPLQDYPDRSVGTTWAISYQAIRSKHEHTANLLLLWSFLDNKDLWHGLFAMACEASVGAARMLSAWVGEIATSELAFSQAIRLLRNYSLVEAVEATASYATHPVVHRWAYHYQGKQLEKELGPAAVAAVGWAARDQSSSSSSALQRRLLPHVQACSSWVLEGNPPRNLGEFGQHELCFEVDKRDHTVFAAISRIGALYVGQGKLAEAALLEELALKEIEAVGPKQHVLALEIVGSLGSVYLDQGKLAEAEHMYKRALDGFTEALGTEHKSTNLTATELAAVRDRRGKSEERGVSYVAG